MLKTPELLDSLQTAFVMINCEAGHENDVVEHIRSVRGVKEALRTHGPHDILSSIEAPTVESLIAIIEKDIRKTPHVKSTTTLVKSY
ncbi:MAG TPA: Lrp/AsnC ligand binding domain-containing protein [Candidatus Nitrosotalea sp.]|nr:Lrp/AsnC ligand binding domain-containing protein [Candidatus Nitrosotalea sp.]